MEHIRGQMENSSQTVFMCDSPKFSKALVKFETKVANFDISLTPLDFRSGSNECAAPACNVLMR